MFSIDILLLEVGLLSDTCSVFLRLLALHWNGEQLYFMVIAVSQRLQPPSKIGLITKNIDL